MARIPVKDPRGNFEETGKQIKAAIQGRTITDVHYLDGLTIELTLDDGRKYHLKAHDPSCCAYTEFVNLVNNLKRYGGVVTAVKTKIFEHTDHKGKTVMWHLLHQSKEILSIEADWNEGTGYYVFGTWLEQVK